MHGKGHIEFADGSEYTGDFYNNKYHGRGTEKMLNGEKYTGDYV